MIAMDTLGSLDQKKHVLIVDDDLELALMYQALLQGRGLRASTAGNGREALKLVKHGDVDAILCDLNMPELAGDLFYLEVGRAHPQLLKRFVFLTGYADSPIYEGFLRGVKAPVLTKPVTFNQLLDKLNTVLAIQPPTPR